MSPRLVKRHRMELLLLGMALARDGDRKKILELVNDTMIRSDPIAQCIRSLRAGDRAGVCEVLEDWGITLNGSLVESLVWSICDTEAKDRMEETLNLLLRDGGVEEIEGRLSSALSLVREYKERS